ncbi:MAG: hypothetical protein R2751_07900 [Bacteroidales bacterium]
MIDRAREAYPGVRAFATTLREVVSVNQHLWGALLWESGNWHVVEPRDIYVYDRIGGRRFCGRDALCHPSRLAGGAMGPVRLGQQPL